MVYEITISAEFVSMVFVKADNEREAHKKVWDMIDSGAVSPLDDEPDYEVITQMEYDDDDESIAKEDICS